MSYEDKSKEPGREPVFLVEITVPRCTRVYGTAPCTAAIGVNGATRKCFNTPSTCQDTANYLAADFVYCHSNRKVRTPKDDDILNNGLRILQLDLLPLLSMPDLLRPANRIQTLTLV